MIPLLLAAGISANPTPNELRAAWQTFEGSAKEHLRVSAPLTLEEDWAELAEGETITRRFRPKEGSINRVLGMRFIDQPPISVWLALLDGQHAKLSTEVTEWTFPGANGIRKTLYQHLDLPFPADDRHWIIHPSSNGTLFRASKGTAWERSWYLDPAGEAALARIPADLQKAGDGAIWTPANRGAWLLVAVGWGTLAVYQLETDIGGWFPDDLVTAFAESRLFDLIDKTAALADKSAVHYTRDHKPIQKPDGTVIEPY